MDGGIDFQFGESKYINVIDCHKIVELLQPFGRCDGVYINSRNYEIFTWEAIVDLLLVSGRVRHGRHGWRRAVRCDD